MPINHEDQINLLKDILNNHQSDCCGSVSECEQLERLITSLKENGNIDQNILPTLEEIHQYSQKGIQSSNINDHIGSYQGQLSQWVDNINALS
ncbi:YtzH-like family protein [Niallia sp. 01092]|uniref:YtzH-like family protein n=1 Tax=unclassified Niallia TaxID=2837522 RepID=UPI003FD6B8CB